MNKTFLKTSMMMALAAATASCGGDKQADTPVIGKQQVTVDNGLMTPEALWAFGRIGTVSVSPDGQRVAYTVSYYSIAENKGNSEIFVMNADGSGKRQLTRSAFQEAAPRWMNDSQRIAYLSNESGSMQAWMMNADGSGKRQLTDREGGIADFAFSPDETRMLFIANVPYGQRVADLHPDLPKATGRVIDDLMYRHWDEWTETVPHPFVADFSLQNGLSNEKRPARRRTLRKPRETLWRHRASGLEPRRPLHRLHLQEDDRHGLRPFHQHGHLFIYAGNGRHPQPHRTEQGL